MLQFKCISLYGGRIFFAPFLSVPSLVALAELALAASVPSAAKSSHPPVCVCVRLWVDVFISHFTSFRINAQRDALELALRKD